MKPTVGRIVHFKSNEPGVTGNGADVVPAIITRVWNDNCVNVTVFPDAGIPISRASVRFNDTDEGGLGNYNWCFWPPRE